jgi:hypothetical protein
MTLGFMACFTIVLGEHVSPTLARRALLATLGFSGHPIKHVAASVAIFATVAAFRRHERAAPGADPQR